MNMDRSSFVIGRRAELGAGAAGILSRSLPLTKLIPVIYDTVICTTTTTTSSISPAQLLTAGQNMLSFIEGLGSLDDAARRKSNEVIEILQVFSKLFERMLKVNFQSSESNRFQEILCKVWDIYKKGLLNFSSTPLPNQLLQEYPVRFEETIIEAITHFNEGRIQIQDHFTNIFTGDTHTFNFTLGYLENIFKSSDYHPSVIQFSKEFLIKVQKSKDLQDYLNLFRIEYYPLITFCTQLELESSKSGQSFESNVIIQQQMLILIENLYKIHQDQDFSSITDKRKYIPSVSFILSIIPFPDIPSFLSKSKENIKLLNYPSVWKTINLQL